MSSYTTFVFLALITKVNLGVFVLKTFHQVILRAALAPQKAVQLKCKNKGVSIARPCSPSLCYSPFLPTVDGGGQGQSGCSQ